MTVTVRRNIHRQIDMETRSVLHNSLRILCHFFVQQVPGIPLLITDSRKTTRTDTTAAALALFRIDISLARVKADSVGAAFLGTFMTVAAKFLIHHALAGRMLLHLAGPAAAAHTQVFNRTAKACHFMPLEMCQTDDNISVHNGPANFSLLHILAIFHRHFHIVSPLETVTDDNLTARGQRIKAVHIGNIHVFQRMFAAAGIQGVAVRQKRQAALLFNQIGYDLGILGTQKCQISHFPKMHFYGHEFAFHVNIFYAGSDTESSEFFQPAGTNLRAKTCEIDLCLLHLFLLRHNIIHIIS